MNLSEFTKEITKAAAGVARVPRPDGRRDRRTGKPVNLRTSTILSVAMAVARHTDYRTGTGAHPGIALIRAETGLSEETVGQCLRVLRDLGWLVCHRAARRSGMADSYDLAHGRAFGSDLAPSVPSETVTTAPTKPTSRLTKPTATRPERRDPHYWHHRKGEKVGDAFYRALPEWVQDEHYMPAFDEDDTWVCMKDYDPPRPRGQ